MLPTLRTVRHARPMMVSPEMGWNMDRWFDDILGRQVASPVQFVKGLAQGTSRHGYLFFTSRRVPDGQPPALRGGL